MVSGCEAPIATDVESKRWSWRDAAPLAWGLLLLAEVLFLTFRFDAATFARQNRWWGALLHQSPQFLRIGVTIAAVLLLISGRGWQALVLPTGAASQRRRGWTWLLAHLAAFGGLVAVSTLLFDSGRVETPKLLPLSLAWWLLGALTLSTWALMARPVSFWLALLRRGKGTLLTAAVVGVLAYGLGNLTMRLWHPLSSWTFGGVNFVLGCWLRDYAVDPQHFIIQTPSFGVEISRQCSGYEGIGLVAIFLLTYLWLFRRHLRFPRALLLVPVAVLVVWVLNVFRIAALVVLGDAGLGELATEGFHSEAGWMAFNAVALGFAALAEHSPLLRVRNRADVHDTESRGPISNPSATTVHLAPLLAMLAAGMVTRACGATPAESASARLLAALLVLWCFRRSYHRLGWSASWAAGGLGLATGLAWIGLVPWIVGHGEMAPSPQGPGSWSVLTLLCQFLTYTLVTPVVEELAFRRYLARRIVSIDFENVDARHLPLVAVALSSVVFGVLHGAYWLPATGAGVVYAVAYRWRGQLGDALLAHALTNLLIAGYVLATGHWSLWS